MRSLDTLHCLNIRTKIEISYLLPGKSAVAFFFPSLALRGKKIVNTLIKSIKWFIEYFVKINANHVKRFICRQTFIHHKLLFYFLNKIHSH